MCATVCPSGALFFGTPEEIAEQRSGTPVNEFVFGGTVVRTKVHVMLPAGAKRLAVDGQAPIRKSDLLRISRVEDRNHG